MSENAGTNAPKTRTPREKRARAYIITAPDGSERCVQALDVRVASNVDLMKALAGDIPTEAKAAQS